MKAIRGKNGHLSLVSLPEGRLLSRIESTGSIKQSELTEQEARLAHGMYIQNLLDMSREDDETVYTRYNQEF